jgi:hypothetical protein
MAIRQLAEVWAAQLGDIKWTVLANRLGEFILSWPADRPRDDPPSILLFDPDLSVLVAWPFPRFMQLVMGIARHDGVETRAVIWSFIRDNQLYISREDALAFADRPPRLEPPSFWAPAAASPAVPLSSTPREPETVKPPVREPAAKTGRPSRVSSATRKALEQAIIDYVAGLGDKVKEKTQLDLASEHFRDDPRFAPLMTRTGKIKRDAVWRKLRHRMVRREPGHPES